MFVACVVCVCVCVCVQICTNQRLQTHAQPNARDHLGQTALHVAVSSRRIDTIRMLLSHGANLWVPDFSGACVGRLPDDPAAWLGVGNTVCGAGEEEAMEDDVLEVVKVIKEYMHAPLKTPLRETRESESEIRRGEGVVGEEGMGDDESARWVHVTDGGGDGWGEREESHDSDATSHSANANMHLSDGATSSSRSGDSLSDGECVTEGRLARQDAERTATEIDEGGDWEGGAPGVNGNVLRALDDRHQGRGLVSNMSTAPKDAAVSLTRGRRMLM